MMQTNISLKQYSNYKIGGLASYFLDISSKQDLLAELKDWKKEKPIFILGSGTNILISDKGFDGLIIHNNILGITRNKDEVRVGAGVLMSDLLDYCIEESLSGLEWAGGLPGSVGGALRGNAGAFKGEIKDNLVNVESVNILTLEEKTKNNLDCEFDYRNSIFKTKARNEFITFATFKLSREDKNIIIASIQDKIDYRKQKHPMDKSSLGSTFKNIPLTNLSAKIQENLLEYVKNDPFPVIPVAKLLFLCDLQGKREGDAQISEKHPNFIVNLGNAKSEDVKKLINFAKKTVRQKFNIFLEEEIIFL